MVDKEIINKAIEDYGNFIYRLALHYLHNTSDAEDVVQEVLLALLTCEIRNGQKIKGWLAKVTVNKSLNLLKKRKRLADSLTENTFPVFSAEKNESLSVALRNLNPIDREIVYLHFYEGYTSIEIGKMIGKTDAAVRKRLERAKIQLKNYLEE